MNRSITARAAFGLWLALCAALAWALVPVPESSHRVTDLTGTLTAAQTGALDARLAQFEARKGSQIAVLIVPTTQPEDIAQFGIRVADAWKIGRDRIDDGVILLVAKDDRTMRIEVGYGLEGVIPDAVAKRIVAEIIVPRFQAGDFAGGIEAGLAQLMKLIEGEALPPPAMAGRNTSNEDVFGLLVVGGVIAGFVLSQLMNRSAAAGVAALGSGAVGALLVGLSPLLLFAALFVFAAVASGFRGGSGGGWSSGGGFGRGGGGFRGGGGGFGGGGASGSW